MCMYMQPMNATHATNNYYVCRVEGWSQKFGAELWVSLSQATRRESIQGQYDSMPQLKVTIILL